MTILHGVEARSEIKKRKAEKEGYDYSVSRGLICIRKDTCIYMRWSNGDAVYIEGSEAEFEQMLDTKPEVKLVKWKDIREMCEFAKCL